MIIPSSATAPSTKERNRLACILLLLFVVGCSAKSKLLVVQPTTYVGNSSDAIGIVIPEDGSYGDHTYPGSGFTVAQRILEILHPSFKNCDIVKSADSSHDYIIVPIIQTWEDRNTPWSSKADVVMIEMTLLNSSRKIVAKLRYENRTSDENEPWIVVTDHPPEHLLDQTFERAVLTLIGKTRAENR